MSSRVGKNHSKIGWLRPGEDAHSTAPAGGTGSGYSRPSSPLVRVWLESRFPDTNSAAAKLIDRQNQFARYDLKQRVLALNEAFDIGLNLCPQAIKKATGQDFHEMLSNVIPDLLAALVIVAVPAGAFAAVGFVAGEFFGLIGGIPGAAAAAVFGADLGLWVLDYLGLGFLAAYIGSGTPLIIPL